MKKEHEVLANNYYDYYEIVEENIISILLKCTVSFIVLG